MPHTVSVFLTGCWMGLALLANLAAAVDQLPTLLGATREQVLARYGAPRSQMAAGDRLVLFYAGQRIVLRNNVVTEIEPLALEPSRRAASSETPPLPIDPAAPVPIEPSPAGGNGGPGEASALTGEPKLEISQVRPPGAKDARPAPVLPAAPTVPPPVATPPLPIAQPVPADSLGEKVSGASAVSPAPGKPEIRDLVVPPVIVPPAATRDDRVKAEALATGLEKDKRSKVAAAARERLDAAAEAPVKNPVTGPTLVGAALIVVAGGGVLAWRYRQRQLRDVSGGATSTRVGGPVLPVVGSGAIFTADLLTRLDRERFEELVAAYYNKTGVVAARTHLGSSSPVHIKISWKGEPRPFAYVQCIAQPSAPVAAKPVQDLVAALAAEDIRRGYVVTTGGFEVAAREGVDEKYITLLAGDIFLEKLNALPASARSEVMQAITAAAIS